MDQKSDPEYQRLLKRRGKPTAEHYWRNKQRSGENRILRFLFGSPTDWARLSHVHSEFCLHDNSLKTGSNRSGFFFRPTTHHALGWKPGLGTKFRPKGAKFEILAIFDQNNRETPWFSKRLVRSWCPSRMLGTSLWKILRWSLQLCPMLGSRDTVSFVSFRPSS